MCIAILNTKNKLKLDYLENSWENNNQGGGLLYNHNGKLITFKTYSKEIFIEEYYKVRKKITGKIVLHFRIATSGHTPYVNLHPFKVNDNLGFVHNGIINGIGNKEYSDTYFFNEMLRELKHDFLNCKQTKKLIANYIGSSKLVFLDSKDNHTIINEKLGHWHEGDWFSNDSYKSYSDFVYYGNEKVYKTSKKNEISEKEFNDRLSWFSNTMTYNLSYLADLLEVEEKSYDLIENIEDISFTINSLDIERIIDYVLTELYNDEQINDKFLY
jgi:hypothetical protein